ncbi:tyrosine-type recombinase/integrase [Tunturiibacter gelidiferens]|uniref:tyrosine-type recombinase/integrase n=1 Tax=Tunturiibacter gelidiferens TaxID=3069689 RepID=UPI003D9B85FF
MLLKTGLRMSEAMHLDWQHVDFDSKILKVREERKSGKKIGLNDLYPSPTI